MQALSKAKIRLFAGLQLKKNRYAEGLFIAEGWKILQEALKSTYHIEAVVIREGTAWPDDLAVPSHLIFEAQAEDYERIATQVTPEGVLTILRIPGPPLVQHGQPISPPPGPAFILAAIQDPGNLGTILRTAEWFGMPSILIGPGTVDPFNPKVVRSSMGSLFRTRLFLLDDLETWLADHASLVACADMEGIPLPDFPLGEHPYVLLGNEALGIAESIRAIPGLARVTIPSFGQAESLNAATAAAVMAWELRRNDTLK